MNLNPSLQYIAIVLILGALIMGGVHQRFGKGLASRLFANIVPLSAMGAIVGRLSADVGTFSIENLGILLVACAIGIVVILRLHGGVVVELRGKSTTLQTSTAQLGSTAKETAAAAAQQATMVTEVSSTLQEIQATSAAAAENAGAVLREASEALEVSREGQNAIAETRRIMQLIGQAGSIVDTVSGLAEKSNLLAVNASIEAAGAGEHGRRFAVVANEVRNLAEQSKRASGQIQQALQLTEQGRGAVDAASRVLDRLTSVVDQATDKARGIAGATQQQAAGIQQITDAMGSVSQGAQESAAAARQIEAAVHDLDDLSRSIREFVGGELRYRS